MWLRIKYDNIMQNDNYSSELPKARSLHSLYNETIVHMDIKLHMNLLTIFFRALSGYTSCGLVPRLYFSAFLHCVKQSGFTVRKCLHFATL